MKQLDILWKGIIEDLPVQFILFFFPNAAQFLDFSKKIEFLDKELDELFPMDHPQHPRYVDKLLKVHTLDGREEWILIHIEVQGYADPHFARRMYTYFYRLLDRYGQPVTALAIFTDDKPDYKPDTYTYEFMGTRHTYQYNTYKVIEQNETELLSHDNPFALVVLTALKAIQSKKATEDDLMQLKTDLFRNMILRQMEKSTMHALLSFLKMYIPFSKPESMSIFEHQIMETTSNIQTMGVEQLILQLEKEKGIAIGEEKGITKGITQGEFLKAKAIASKMIVKGYDNTEIMDISGLTLDQVEAIRKEMN